MSYSKPTVSTVPLQKSLYYAKYDPLHEDCRDEFISLSTSEPSKRSKCNFRKNVVVVITSGFKNQDSKEEKVEFESVHH